MDTSLNFCQCSEIPRGIMYIGQIGMIHLLPLTVQNRPLSNRSLIMYQYDGNTCPNCAKKIFEIFDIGGIDNIKHFSCNAQFELHSHQDNPALLILEKDIWTIAWAKNGFIHRKKEIGPAIYCKEKLEHDFADFASGKYYTAKFDRVCKAYLEYGEEIFDYHGPRTTLKKTYRRIYF